MVYRRQAIRDKGDIFVEDKYTHMNLFAVLRDEGKGHMNNLLCRWPRDRLSVFNTALGRFKLRDR